MEHYKTCFKCKEIKNLEDFYKHGRMADGHLNKCKVCTKMDVGNHRVKNIDKVREYDRARANLPHRIKKTMETTRKWRKKHPERYAAHKLLNSAIKSGKITKPKICSECGGKLQIEGHHSDYCRPLEVEWLCSACHSARHNGHVTN